MTALDTTDPAAIIRVDAALDPARTLIVVATKSGTTIETMSLFAHWWERIADGRHFIAITDAGSPLDQIARERGFRSVLPHTADPIGRFGAFTPVGTLPAAWLGLNLGGWLLSARAAFDAFITPSAPLPSGGWHAAAAALIHPATYEYDRDSENLAAVLWLSEPLSEALAAVSAPVLPLIRYGSRNQAHAKTGRIPVGVGWTARFDSVSPAERRRQRVSGWARYFVETELDWPVAATLIGPRPDRWVTVDESKSRIKALVARVESDASNGRPEPERAQPEMGKRATLRFGSEGSLWWPDTSQDTSGPLAIQMVGNNTLKPQLDRPHFGSDLASAIGEAKAGEIIALCPFFAPDEEEEQGLRTLFASVAAVANAISSPNSERDVAVTRWDGPALLHSTGQLLQAHDTGVTFVITRQPKHDIRVPGRAYTFGTLLRAQAQGFLESLWARDRRAIGIHLASGGGLAHLAVQLKEAVT